MNPSKVNKVFPDETVGDAPAAVRIKLYTSHGCLPNSAVYHPVVLAIYGKGIINMSDHKIHLV